MGFVTAIIAALAALTAALLWLEGRSCESKSTPKSPSPTAYRGGLSGKSNASFTESLANIARSVEEEKAPLVHLDHIVHRVLPRLEAKLDAALEFLGVIISDQEHLDADVAALVDATVKIGAEIAALKAQPAAEALDFSGLDSAVAAVSGLVPAPVEAPVDQPTE